MQQSRCPSTLPDKSYFTLTEAVTWLMEGVPHTSRFVAERCTRTEEEHRASRGAPSWEWDKILADMELLSEVDETGEKHAGLDDEYKPSRRHRRERARRWLARFGGDELSEASNTVRLWCRARDANFAEQRRVYSAIWDLCAGEKIRIKAIKNAKGGCAGVHGDVPPEFFLMPVHHNPASDDGALEPTVDGEEPFPLYRIMRNEDQRACFLAPKISRDDLLTLAMRLFPDPNAPLSRICAKLPKGSRAEKLQSAIDWLKTNPGVTGKKEVVLRLMNDGLLADGKPPIQMRTFDRARSEVRQKSAS